jgi:4-amino-4-deoxy-L-arabinose transferase-like glycosyltransferase
MSDTWPPAERHWDRLAVAAIVLGAVARIVWTAFLHPPVDYVYSDMEGYVLRAQHLASGAPLTASDAFYPPGTQILLAIPLALFGPAAGPWVSAAVWCALSIATVFLSWRLARALLTPAAAALTAVLCAAWPLFITYGGYFTSETPALAFLVAALWAGVAATRRDGWAGLVLALSAGLLGGVATAVRPQLLVNMLILAVVVSIASRRRVAPVLGYLAGLLLVLALVVGHNSLATHRPTGLAMNGGLNFWFGHCEARHVTTFNEAGEQTADFTHPVPQLTGRGDDYVFRGREAWDEGFFLGLGRECIEQDGVRHLLRLGRNVLDMTATTMPWPQNESEGWSRDLVQVANVLYSVLLPWIVIEALFLLYRRRTAGEAFLLVNLACVVVVAVLLLGDPRVRTLYDVFGFALLAALLADRFRLDRPQVGSSDTWAATIRQPSANRTQV